MAWSHASAFIQIINVYGVFLVLFCAHQPIMTWIHIHNENDTMEHTDVNARKYRIRVHDGGERSH